MMRLLELPGEVLDMLKEGKISTGHARALLSLKNPADAAVLANKIHMRGLSVREIEAAVKRLNVEFLRGGEKEKSRSGGDEQTGVYLRELERRSMSLLGRRVKINSDRRKQTVELSYVDNDDLEAILRKLCGSDLFEGDN